MRGNRPRDVAAQQLAENIDVDDLLDWITEHGDDEIGYDVAGCVVYFSEGLGVWLLESPAPPWLPDWPHTCRPTKSRPPDLYALLRFDTVHDAIAYAVEFHDDDTIEQIVEQRLEDFDPYDDEPPDPY